jgi:hypothetical protein
MIFCCIGRSSFVSHTASEQAENITSSMSVGPESAGEGGGEGVRERDALVRAAADRSIIRLDCGGVIDGFEGW